MIIRLTMDGDGAEEELRSLCEWLLNDPDIRNHARVSWESAPPKPGEMGAAEWLQVITDNGWQVANFTVAYLTWRQTRPIAPEVTIERNGVTVTVKGADDTEIAERIAAAFSRE